MKKSIDNKSTNFSDKKYRVVVGIVFAALLLTVAASLALGRYSINLGDVIKILASKIFGIKKTWSNIEEAVVINLRLPRTLTSVVVGAGLALSGACYQSIFKNPMASPDLLGVSSGACIGAAVAILLNFNSLFIQLLAFIGGIAAVFITTLIPKLIKSQSTTILILSGVVVSSLMSSVMSVIKALADTDTQLAEITYWTMGSFATITMSELLSILPMVLIPCFLIILMRYRLNVLSLGDNEARSLGINLQKTRGMFIFFSTLITASCVSVSGSIGWVGLIIPHTSRMLIGSDNKKMLPMAMLLGSIFMLIIDMLCRTLSTAELKLGVLTGIIGAPFFIFILIKQNRTLT